MTLSKAGVAVLMLALAFAGVPARADEGRAVEIARRSFEEGMDQYRRGDLEDARISLIQSYAAWPSVETLRNLAIAELNTDHVLEALTHFKTYAEDKNADPEFVNTRLPYFIERCEQRIGQLHVTAPPKAPFVASTVAGASPESGGSPFDASNRTSREQETMRAPSGTAPVPFWTARNAWAIAIGAAAVVSAGVGLGFGLAANSQRSTIESLRAGRDSSFCTAPENASYCGSLRSEVAAQRRDATASTVAFGTAGALAAGAIVLWAVWPKASPRLVARWWLSPSVGRGWGAMTVAGQF